MISGRLGIYCKCIENNLPKSPGTSLKAKSTDKIDIYEIQFLYPESPLSAKEVLLRLKKFGLSPHERKLVYYTAVLRRPFKVTAAKMGWLSAESASYHYRKALAKLRAGRFRLR